MLADNLRLRWNPLAMPWAQRLQRRQAAEKPAQPAQRQAVVSINLIAAQRSQAIIDLRFAGIEGVFQSAIVAVDVEAGLIVIDEWFPKEFRAQTGHAVSVSLRLGNRREQFDTRIAEQLTVDGRERYTLHLPPTVGYEQRRNAYRLTLREGQANGDFTAAHFRYHAAVRDLSSLGIRLELCEWRPLPIGSLLQNLEFELLGEHFHCAASVRNVRDNREGGTEIGAAFIDLPRSSQRDLERLIMRLQRRQLRHPSLAAIAD